MKKLIALIIALVACAVAPYAWLTNKFQKELKLNEELRQYRKDQAEVDIVMLQEQLNEALVKLPTEYLHQAIMNRQTEILNRMYRRI